MSPLGETNQMSQAESRTADNKHLFYVGKEKARIPWTLRQSRKKLVNFVSLAFLTWAVFLRLFPVLSFWPNVLIVSKKSQQAPKVTWSSQGIFAVAGLQRE